MLIKYFNLLWIVFWIISMGITPMFWCIFYWVLNSVFPHKPSGYTDTDGKALVVAFCTIGCLVAEFVLVLAPRNNWYNF